MKNPTLCKLPSDEIITVVLLRRYGGIVRPDASRHHGTRQLLEPNSPIEFLRRDVVLLNVQFNHRDSMSAAVIIDDFEDVAIEATTSVTFVNEKIGH